MTAVASTASLSFPRTGKRGVPQQFPRRLYEMLDGESQLCEESAFHPKIIAWSDSGKAFRIHDASAFSDSVLPKYFRTKKFSSFQRNLNLYGFAKVRRGPDVDMYSHPSFMRDHPENLILLRKMSTSSRQGSPPKERKVMPIQARPISPSSSTSSSDSSSPVSSEMLFHKHIDWACPLPPLEFAPIPDARPQENKPVHRKVSEDRGKLDLLAFALEQAELVRSSSSH